MKKQTIQKINGDFVIYETDDKITKVNVRLDEETVWLTQSNLADLFQTSRPNVTMHIKNILEEGELQEVSVRKNFLHAAADGKNYNTKYYSLDMIISLGYRINSKVAAKFRQWATERLKEHSVDYDFLNQTTIDFFATVQNKMHDVVHCQTAAEVAYNRAYNEKPMIGMTKYIQR